MKHIKLIPTYLATFATCPVFLIGYLWELSVVWFEFGRDVFNDHIRGD